MIMRFPALPPPYIHATSMYTSVTHLLVDFFILGLGTTFVFKRPFLKTTELPVGTDVFFTFINPIFCRCHKSRYAFTVVVVSVRASRTPFHTVLPRIVWVDIPIAPTLIVFVVVVVMMFAKSRHPNETRKKKTKEIKTDQKRISTP